MKPDRWATIPVLAAFLLTACATAPVSDRESADLDFSLGAYPRAIEAYERMLAEAPQRGDRDQLRFRLALSYLLAPSHSHDPVGAGALLNEVESDVSADAFYRVAAGLLGQTIARADELRRRLNEQAIEQGARAAEQTESSAHMVGALTACETKTKAAFATIAKSRDAAAVCEAEIDRLEGELERLAVALERFKEIDTEPPL